MSGVVTLSLRSPLEQTLEVEAITADRFARSSAAEIASLPVWLGSQQAQLGDLFSVAGERSPHIRIEGDLTRVNRLGAGMTTGRIDVMGNVGHEAGMAMAGGVLHISGNAGDRLGAASPGASRGMTGGEAIVLGSAGRDAGARARRGLIVVGGDTGPQAARDIIAGTLIVLGKTGPDSGLGSKRGSIVAVGGIDVPPTYQYACTYEPPYVRLVMTYLRRSYGLPIDDGVVIGRYRRYCGDAGDPGKGEILARLL